MAREVVDRTGWLATGDQLADDDVRLALAHQLADLADRLARRVPKSLSWEKETMAEVLISDSDPLPAKKVLFAETSKFSFEIVWE